MDPQACFDSWLRNARRGRRSKGFTSTANEFRGYYNGWRKRGGFCAKDSQGREVSHIAGPRTYWVVAEGSRPVVVRIVPTTAAAPIV